MNLPTPDLVPPCVLVVDDEKQIHSSIRLRLGDQCQLVCLSSPREAIALVRRQEFDLCIIDVHMPEMDGLEFVEQARGLDPALGYVVISGFDSAENLKRTIPLQVFDFIAKPLPNKIGFESRIPEWIGRTRQRRQELALARHSASMVEDLELARIESDVASTASESAREALLQTASLLTTTQALLLNASLAIDALDRKEPRFAAISRSLHGARRSAEEAAQITDAYFSSAYADRESSPAIVDTCLLHAAGIAQRRAKADERHQSVDLTPLGRDVSVSGITGIDFLIMMVPALIQSLELASPDTTVSIRCEEFTRLGDVVGDTRWRDFFWVNRRNFTSSSPGITVCIRASGRAPTESAAADWLHGKTSPLLRTPSRGILQGILKSKGLLGLACAKQDEKFEMILGLPV